MIRRRRLACNSLRLREGRPFPRWPLSVFAVIARVALLPIARLDIDEAAINPQVGKGLIIAANHRSNLDFIVGIVAFQKWKVRPYIFVRGDYCQLPVVGTILRSLGAIPTGRGAPKAGRRAKELLALGQVLAITPEGRIPEAEQRVNGIAGLKPGIGHLAVTHGTPILLLGIANTDACWPLGKHLPKIRISPRKRPIVRFSVEFLVVPKTWHSSDVVREVGNGLIRILSRIDN